MSNGGKKIYANCNMWKFMELGAASVLYKVYLEKGYFKGTPKNERVDKNR